MNTLVLSGGGVAGAYQAGAIKRLTDEGITHDMYVGSSVGAINAAFLAQFASGSEREASYQLWDIWYGIRNESVYRKWLGGMLGHLPVAWKPSIFDPTPIHTLIDAKVDTSRLQSSGKHLHVIASSTQSRSWSHLDVDIKKAIKASSAYPRVFPAIEIDGIQYVDGVVTEPEPTTTALSKGACTIDVISTLHQVSNHVNVRRQIRLKNTPAKHPFDFRPCVVHELLERGYNDALA